MLNSLNHITLATNDLLKSFKFYKDILGFKPLCKWHAGAYFLVGDLWFCLNLDDSHKPSKGYTHIAFNVDEVNFENMKNAIIKSGTTIFKENISEGNSLYFLDPVGHKLEIHVGSWETRVNAKKQSPGTWQDVEFFI